MRTAVSIFVVMLTYALPAQATVYEFHSDGTMVKHEAFDYRSQHGEGQYAVILPAVLVQPAAEGFYESYIQQAATSYGLSPALLRAVMDAESAGKKDAVSPKGAQGLMQLMPATAKQYGVSDPFDPAQSIDGGARYLSYLFTRYDGDRRLALAAYNAGEGTVDKYGGIPPYAETKAYVRKIEGALKRTSKN